MNKTEFFQWLANSELGVYARDDRWAFPMFETLHFIGLCMLFGAIMLVDLRVMGWVKGVAIANVMHLIRVAMAGFALNLVSGIAFFCSDPENYWGSVTFRWKMALVLLGGINALAFEFFERRKLEQLPVEGDAGLLAKGIAGLSIAIWLGVIILGRLLPYVGGGAG